MMNEILSGIKVIKFYGWELSFENIIEKIRSTEIDCLKKIGFLNVTSFCVWTTSSLIVTIVSFTSFVLLNDDNLLDASTVFVSLSLLNILRLPMSSFPYLISSLINVSF